LTEYHEKIIELEQSLDQVENEKDDLVKEKNKWLWEYQKRQKILDETISDLEMANEKCKQLSIELESKSNELEKLRLFKFMVRHSESREEVLTSKLEDTNQELALCRRNELVLESKIKKLKTRYESLYNAHEQLSKHVEENSALNDHHRHHTSDALKFTSPSTRNTDDLINLIKELSVSNTKLKSELLNSKDQLLEAREEIITLSRKSDRDSTATRKSTDLFSEINMKAKTRRATSVKEKKKKKESMPIRHNTVLPSPLPTVSSSMPNSICSESSPVVHHHYHYYVKGEQMDDSMSDTSEEKTRALLQEPNQQDTIESSSPTSSILTIKRDGTTVTNQSPYFMLQEHVAQVLDRLRGSDIRTLNRRLKRAFDITELSSMSNAIIDNILMDVDTLETRFLWVTDTVGFFPLLDLFKDMLKELGLLKSTMNELQVDYVQKIEKNEIRVQEEILRKRQQKRSQVVNEPKPLSWLINLFTKADPLTHSNVSTLTKTTTNASTLIPTIEEDEHLVRKEEDRAPRNTFPHPIPETKRRPKPIFNTPPTHAPIMHTSSSTGTNRSAVHIRNKRSLHRIHIDYEGIGPAAIRPIPSDRDLSVTANFSSSWLGGK
ncbi:hypothetical protein CU098_000891, partial [Rhizopus stolonifer]